MQSVGLVLIILAILIIGLCMTCSVKIISQQKRIEPGQEYMHLPSSYLLLPLALCVILNESFCFRVFHFSLCEHRENDVYLVT